MKMRKFMAVLLAVVVAISAMAISVFADEVYTIDMYNYNKFDTSYTSTYTIEIPAYALYGYATAGESFTLTLPAYLGGDGSIDIDYTLTVNGVTVSLESASESDTPITYTITDGTYDAYGNLVTYEVYKFWEGSWGTNYGQFDTYGNSIIAEGTKLTSYDTAVSYYYVDADDYDADGTMTTVVTQADFEDTANSWSLTATCAADTFTQTVEVGAFQRDYYNDTSVAMVPQSTAVANTTPIVITAAISQTSWSVFYYEYLSNPYSSNSSPSYYTSEVITYTDANGVESTLWGYNISCTKSDATSVDSPYIVIVANSASGNGSAVYTEEYVDAFDSTDVNDGEILTWDHTLANRATILNAVSTEGATAKLVVVLGGAQSYYTPIYGTAVYTLNVYSEDASYGSSSSVTGYWYSSGTSALTGSAVSTCIINGYANTLEFEVPISYLYNSTYGLYNGYMTIQQSSVDTVTSFDYRYYNNTNWWSKYQLTATEVYLELTVPSDDDSDVNVDPAVEDTNSSSEDDGEDETLDVGDDAEEPETNPTTGIVLALVPMAVAAAAAVASKRR
ncbi:MAG: hypothetical protein LUG49_07095 [Oscillospiraceae bacterium]|nr:hypothetical protein [Oscillospiraceae bacterium]